MIAWKTASDAMVANAPTWDQVLRVTDGRKILAYNAEYDQAVTVGDCQWGGRSAAPER